MINTYTALLELGVTAGYIKASGIPSDHPHRALFARLESNAQNDIAAALDVLRRDTFRGVKKDNPHQALVNLRSQETNERLRQALYVALLPTLNAASALAIKELERQVLGVKAITDFGFNWELVNEKAREWLKKHTFGLTYANVYSITETTAKGLQSAIDDFITSPDMTMPQLTDRVAGLFDVIRAEMIAVTEVTRSFAEANRVMWQESGVVSGKRWQTASDEIVCPICAPLNGRVAALGESFPGFIESPPAHPRCRCWLTPVVDVDEVAS
jgi:SPP1 gp7 family putative phage head morphogenesis protein